MSVGKRISYYLERNEMQQKELAKKINMDAAVLNRIIKGTRAARDNELSDIANVFHVTTDELLGRPVLQRGLLGDLDKKATTKGILRQRGVKIPVYGEIAAGVPIDAVENIEDWEEIPEDWTNGGAEYFALRVRGGSMEPKIHDGDIAIIKKQESVDSGQIAAVLIGNEAATIKKIRIRPDGITLIALDADIYEPHFYTNPEVTDLPVAVLGLVVESRTSFI